MSKNLVGAIALRAMDANGDPVASANLYVFEEGTTTPVTTYSDEAQTTAQAHPVVGNADGSFPEIYLDGATYTIDIRTSGGSSLPGYPKDFDVGGNEVQFNSRAQLSTESPGSVDYIRTAGYTTAGDGGHALYRRVASQPAHAGWVQSADGLFWELVPEKGVISFRQFGGLGYTDAADASPPDDTAAVQNAIDYAMYFGGNTFSAQAVRVVLDAESIRTTDTIHLGYGSTGFQGGLIVEGMGVKRRNENTNLGTSIVPDFTDRPVFNFQAARYGRIAKMSIEGSLSDDYAAIDYTGITPTLEATWDAVHVDNRYAPFAGITIDAYSGAAPGTAYPSVTYPSFLGAVSQYGKGASSQIEIEDIEVRGVVVAFCNKPSNDASNADFTHIIRCKAEYCKWGISVGNSQSRNLRIEDFIGAFIYRGMTGSTHGQQTGQFGGPIHNCSFGGFIGGVFRFPSLSAAKTPGFSDCFAELLDVIGEVTGGGSTETALRLENCDFNFRHSSTDCHPARVLSGASTRGVITFDTCTFTGFDSVIVFEPVETRLVNCHGVPGSARSKEYEKLAHNNLGGGFVCETTNPRPQRIIFAPYNVGTGAVASGVPRVTDETYSLTDRNHTWPIWALTAQHGSTVWETVERPVVTDNDGKSSLTVSRGSGADAREITLTFVSLAEQEAFLRAKAPGDVVRDPDTDTIWFIRSFTTGASGNIIMEQQNNYYLDGANYVDIDTIDTASGVWEFIKSSVYTTTFPLRGDTNSNTSITGLEIAGSGGPDAWGATAATTGPAAGDWYYASEIGWVPISAGASAEIASLDTGSDTIIMAGSTLATETDVPLKSWLRAPPANEASR